MATLYTQQSKNVFRTWLLMAIFIVIVVAIGWFISYYYNDPSIIVIAIIFALVMMGAIFVITNLEFPHASLLNLDDMSSELVVLRRSM